MNKKLDIFVCSHEESNLLVKNQSYKLLDSNNLFEFDICDYPIKRALFYSEIASYFKVAEEFKLKKYVGFCHYRKYFRFRDDIPDLDKVLSNTQVILPKPLMFKKTIRETYGICHNIDDYDLIGKIIEEKYPEYKQSFDTLSNAHSMFPCNMFIMKREDFLDYIKFIKGVLDEFVNRIGTNIEQRIIDNKDKYLKTFAPNNTIEYQYRIGGYLAERLSNVYYLKHFKTATMYDMIITEQKYDSEKGKITKIEMTK